MRIFKNLDQAAFDKIQVFLQKTGKPATRQDVFDYWRDNIEEEQEPPRIVIDLD